MKSFFTFFLLVVLSAAAFAQGGEKPLSQAEYVRMLFEFQSGKTEKSEIISALRIRGVSFIVNDGVRGLTRTKTKNDEDIRRALEEAERRRANPIDTKPPTEKESTNLIERSRSATLEFANEMPDFVVKQIVQRSVSYAGTGNFTNLDKLIIAVSYSGVKEIEDYKLLSLNGVAQDTTKPNSYSGVGGTTSRGEFVTLLSTVFKPESKTVFEFVQTDVIRGRKTYVYSVETARALARQTIMSEGSGFPQIETGIIGKVWIDRENFRVLRLEAAATEIPADYPVRSAKRTVDYDWVTISDEKYLLPIQTDVRLVAREGAKQYESRNLIYFRSYQKFGTEVRIVEEDDAEIPADAKPQQ